MALLPDANFNRRALLEQGLRLEYFTVVWNVLEAVVAVVAGWLANSIALIGFGLDSVIESLSGVILLWRLRVELKGVSSERVEKTERKALWGVGITFWLLAAYVGYEATKKLLTREAPESSPMGIALAAVSLVVMPFLAWRKWQVAKHLDSRALEADAMETLVCAYLSLTLLLGLSLSAWLGWWWTDPVAALFMLPLLVREGWEAVMEARGRSEESNENSADKASEP